MSSLSRDHERHTVTLELDNILEWEFSDDWSSSSGSVTIPESDFDEQIRPAIIRLGVARGAAPLNWSTRDGITPSAVRTALPTSLFSKASVVAMLDAADEAHRVRLYEENAVGGKAREEAAKLRTELEELQAKHDELRGYAARMESERDDWKARSDGFSDELSRQVHIRTRQTDDLRLSFNVERKALKEACDKAVEQRNAWKDAMEAMDEKHVRPLRQELAELKAAHEECRAQRRAARGAAGRTVFHLEAGVSPFVPTLPFTLGRQHIPVNAPDAESDATVDELRAVVVSQAREIAKLKGESE